MTTVKTFVEIEQYPGESLETALRRAAGRVDAKELVRQLIEEVDDPVPEIAHVMAEVARKMAFGPHMVHFDFRETPTRVTYERIQA